MDLFLEAPPRIELGMKVLQTSALPLGYGAIFWYLHYPSALDYNTIRFCFLQYLFAKKSKKFAAFF